MNDDFSAAKKYLSSPAGSFWKWADNGRVIVWAHRDTTIAFGEELSIILGRFCGKGLPSLDAVLLVLAALKPSWNEDNEKLRDRLVELLKYKNVSPEHVDSSTAATEKLAQFRMLPSSVTKTIDGKSDLIEMIFEIAPAVVTPSVSMMVCEILQDGMLRDSRTIVSLPRLRGGRVQSTRSLAEDLRLIDFGTPENVFSTLELRQRTGLMELPSPAEIELVQNSPVESDVVRALIHQLMQDDSLYGVAKVARSLSAVVSWPRPIDISNDMPLGGVSDLSNRGSLDRLLLSELAHDDLMLATRVALNEALYLRRESPPSPPPQHRSILIDTGLRMWGVPRLFSTAVALSIASSGEATTTTHHARGDTIISVDLASVNGITSLLASLEPAAHPGKALGAFHKHLQENTLNSDVFFITTPAVLTDPEFQKDWSESNPPPQVYFATVERTGQFQLWGQHARTRKLLSSVKLDLDELLKPPAKEPVAPSKKLIDASLDPRLPAIFRTLPFPLRLPCDGKHEALKHSIWSVPYRTDVNPFNTNVKSSGSTSQTSPSSANANPSTDVSAQKEDQYGVMVLSRDRRLMFFDHPRRGARQIAEGIPFGHCLWSGTNPERTETYALIHRASDINRDAASSLTLYKISLSLHLIIETHTLASEFLSRSGAGSKVLGATEHDGILFVIYATRIEVFSVHDGSLIHTEEYDGANVRWLRGRFFRFPKVNEYVSEYDREHLMSFDGQSLRFDQIPLRGPHRTGILLTLFERRGSEGPFGVHLRGSIGNLSDDTEWRWTELARGNPKVLDISSDGCRVLIEQDNDTDLNVKRLRKLIQYDVNQSQWVVAETNFTAVKSLAELDLCRMPFGPTLPHRFTRIAVEPDGTVILISKRGVAWKIAMGTQNHQRNMLVMQADPHWQGPTQMIAFEPSRHPNSGCTLAVATWEDGSRVFLDSRGMLHLQSSDISIPEVTLVLNEHGLSGWTSHENYFGPSDYCFLPQDVAPILSFEVVQTILKPFAERLR